MLKLTPGLALDVSRLEHAARMARGSYAAVAGSRLASASEIHKAAELAIKSAMEVALAHTGFAAMLCERHGIEPGEIAAKSAKAAKGDGSVG